MVQSNGNGNGNKDVDPNDVDVYQPVVWDEEERVDTWFKSKPDSSEGEIVFELPEELQDDEPESDKSN